MGGLFDKFTERARRVLNLAQEEALRLNHNYIGTEHLLLGLVREGDGVAAKVLVDAGIELNKIRSSVEFIIGRGDRAVTAVSGFTLRAKKANELALDEARRLGHHYIGTEHLLLGLVGEGEGIGAGVLEASGVTLEGVRAEVDRILATAAPGAARPRVTPRGRRRAEVFWDTSRAYGELLAFRNLLAHEGLVVQGTRLARRAPGEMSVTPIFGGRRFSTDDNLCFVLMPFTDKLRPLYEDHISKAVEGCGLQSVRADDVFKPGQVMEHIWEHMNCARVVIADLTGKNPNVFYELGIAHTLGKPVILITQSQASVPFDLRHLRFIKYTYTQDGCRDLERKLGQAIRAVIRPSSE